ncbi:hypothetical protein DRP05_00800 [Archaeoglobales archaeon]|nr:MAG: hypothetical protein DRP05_00800 [Archaeoglobales archaeon]
MAHSDRDELILYPHRVKVKVATYFFNTHVTLSTLRELHGEIISEPVVIHLRESIELGKGSIKIKNFKER